MIDSARRAQDKRKSHRIFLFHAEPQPILLKDDGFPVENQNSL